jgi:hypothetical protein
MAKYFFPEAALGCGNMILARFGPEARTYASFACSFHNVFEGLMSHPQLRGRDSFHLFPVMAIYRHALELLLKAIVQDTCEQEVPNTHNLCGLLDRCLETRAVSSALGNERDFVEEAICELQNLDPGDAFRYAKDTKGSDYFSSQPDTVDVEEAKRTCERLWTALWRVHGPVRFGPAS